jgi:hypothetical protein
LETLTVPFGLLNKIKNLLSLQSRIEMFQAENSGSLKKKKNNNNKTHSESGGSGAN